MLKQCAWCDGTFEALRNKKTCCPECQKKYKQKKEREYYHEHKEQMQANNKRWHDEHKEQVAEYQREYAKKRWARIKLDRARQIKETPWKDKYEKADRVTKLSMMSLALTEHNIATMNYGYLSFIYGTEEYKRLEEKVYKAKEAI